MVDVENNYWKITYGLEDREGCRQKGPTELLWKHWQELQRCRGQARWRLQEYGGLEARGRVSVGKWSPKV